MSEKENNVIASMPLKSRVIGVLSGKGGVGKTTISTNIAASLAYNYREDVVLIDANTTSAGTSLHLGQYDYPISLNDVLNDKAHVSQAIYQHPSGLRFIPATTSIKNLVAKHNKLKQQVINELEDFVDYIILDCSPTLGDESLAGIEASKEIIVVTNTDWASILEAKRTIEFVKKKNKKMLGVIVNKSEKLTEEFSAQLQKNLGAKILGTIREDNNVKAEVDDRTPIIHSKPYSKASKDMRKIIEIITGTEYDTRMSLRRRIKTILN